MILDIKYVLLLKQIKKLAQISQHNYFMTLCIQIINNLIEETSYNRKKDPMQSTCSF
jgi:hypothetical protein